MKYKKLFFLGLISFSLFAMDQPKQQDVFIRLPVELQDKILREKLTEIINKTNQPQDVLIAIDEIRNLSQVNRLWRSILNQDQIVNWLITQLAKTLFKKENVTFNEKYRIAFPLNMPGAKKWIQSNLASIEKELGRKCFNLKITSLNIKNETNPVLIKIKQKKLRVLKSNEIIKLKNVAAITNVCPKFESNLLSIYNDTFQKLAVLFFEITADNNNYSFRAKLVNIKDKTITEAVLKEKINTIENASLDIDVTLKGPTKEGIPLFKSVISLTPFIVSGWE